ncbi:MAG: hypothetical protein R2729_20615 [Bryobacteraceae bacterium]
MAGPYKNFKFKLLIDGAAIASCQSLQGISSPINVAHSPMEMLQVSGVKPLDWRTLRGVVDCAALDRASEEARAGALLLKHVHPFPGHERLVVNPQSIAKAPRMQAGAGSILLDEPAGEHVQQWMLTGASPMKALGPAMRIDGLPLLAADQWLLLFGGISPARP